MLWLLAWSSRIRRSLLMYHWIAALTKVVLTSSTVEISLFVAVFASDVFNLLMLIINLDLSFYDMCEFYLARVNDNVFHFLFGMSVFKLWIFNKDRIVVILNLDLAILIFYLLANRSTNINFKNTKSIFSIFTNLMDSIYYLTYLKYFWVLLRYIQSSLKFCKSFIIH